MVLITAALCLPLASAAYAEGQGRWEKKHEWMDKELKLTPDQKAKLEMNRQAQDEKMKATRSAIKEKHRQLSDALKDPACTRQDVSGIINDIKALQGQMIDGRLDGIFAVKGILTSEQFAKFQDHMAKQREERKNRMGDKPHRGE